MRLIDANELRDIFLHEHCLFEPIDVVDYIDSTATVKAEPVRHGHWINSDYIGVDMPVVCCSVCEIRFCDVINNHRYMYHYCPNCGAKMDEVEKSWL